jgi:3-oxoacyl-[acyl-carrier-protein] synthase II
VNRCDDIVISGATAWCSLGFGRAAILEAMCAGNVAIDRAPAMEQTDDECPRAAQATDVETPIGAVRDRAEHLVERVVASALKEAGLDMHDERRRRTIFGTTIGALRHVGEGLRTDDLDALRCGTTATLTCNALQRLAVPAGGSTVSAACASGLTSIMLGAVALRRGEVDVVVAVGYDPISEFPHAGFLSLRLVAEGPIRPFTKDREGMRVGEGAAAIVLERRSDAIARGATILAVLAGEGAASDAHHLTQPEPNGAGAARALTRAMGNATPDVVFTHATATPANDAAEYEALAATLGEALASTPVTALKSRIGHTLGAAGAIETVVAIAAMEAGVLPPTANATCDKEAFESLDLVVEPRKVAIERAAIVSLGFGGADAAIQLSTADANAFSTPNESVEIVVSGFGVLLPEVGEATVSDAKFEPLGEDRAVRRIARMSRLVRGASTLAARSAKLSGADLAATMGIAASRFGAVVYTLDYYEEIVRDGHGAGNPLLFAESVPNIGSAHLSLGLGLNEATFSIGGTRTAGIEAIDLARQHLEAGLVQRVLVVAAEETDPRLTAILRRLGFTESGEGAVAFVLETKEEASRRGATEYATLKDTCVFWPQHNAVPARRQTVREGLAWATGRGERLDRTKLARCGPLDTHAVGPFAAMARSLGESRTRCVTLAVDEAGCVGGVAFG